MKIAFIGAGNLATQLGLKLVAAGHNVVQVYSRTESSASALADQLSASWTTELPQITADADLYISALSDKVMADVLSAVDFGDKLLVHTAGSIPMSALSPFSSSYGVFYPLQTFSKSRKVDFSVIPICIEANSQENVERLVALGKTISDDVRLIDSVQRKQLHLSAVMVCNFVNHMYALGESLLAEKGVDFDVLHPLIQETAAKAQAFSPATVQTGPAVRYDENVIKNHLGMLEGKDSLQDLYESISQSIHKFHQS